MAHQVTSTNPGELNGISAKTNDIHFSKLYTGYVNKRNEVEQKLGELESTDLDSANQVYSAYRGLKEGETFAANGMILHEVFFDILGGDGKPSGKLYDDIVAQWGSWEKFESIFTASGMAARGWAILAYDPSDALLHIYQADAQNQGGVWGATPLITLDVYEHAYMIDFGADRKAYIAAFMQNLNWDKINTRYTQILK
jgi:Fe-Mn family superoxide dismutase